jgi:hypothetical protein
MLASSFSSCLRCFLALLCTCGLLPALHAQSTEADLKARLMDKPLYLRGFWRDDKLQFDSTGHLLGNSDPVTFTLSGFDLKKVHLKQDKLILEGRRVGLELAANKQIRVPLDTSIQIDIATSPTGDYGPALDAIFANNLVDLVPTLPFYWQPYAVKNFVRANSAAGPSTMLLTATKPDSGGQSLTPLKTKPPRSGAGPLYPKLLHSENLTSQKQPAVSSMAETFWFISG